jgi:acyl carrier protein
MPGSFDVVIGANVVHATRDVQATLGRIRSLLAPGGLVILVESTGHHAWHDISTGLIEGWQHFTDDLRSETPLLTAEVWRRLLVEIGFDAVTTLPGEESAAAVLKQHIVLGTTSVAPPPSTASTASAEGSSSSSKEIERGTTELPPAAGDATPVRDPVALGADFPARLRAAIGSEREEMAIAAVREQVMDVLRADPANPPPRDARLMDLGLDSLMAVRLRNQLQKSIGLPKKLPATLMFDYPSIRQIATLIVDIVTAETPGDVDATDPPDAEDADEARRAEVATMSDDEIAAVLDLINLDGIE